VLTHIHIDIDTRSVLTATSHVIIAWLLAVTAELHLHSIQHIA